jgi:hypothetical protein
MPIVGLDNRFGKRKPYTDSLKTFFDGGTTAMEHLKDVGKIMGPDAMALVGYGDGLIHPIASQ